MAGVGEVYCAACDFCIPEILPVIQRSIDSIHRGGTFMKKLSRLYVVCLLFFSILLILPATLVAQQRPPILEQIATVTDQGTKKLPIGAGSATLVSVKYPAEAGGYTPGDTWDLYVGKDHRVQAMVYHRGGTTKPSLVTATWTGYKKAGPLLVSTEHRGTADGKPLHIFISDVAIKLTGSDTWMKAQ